MSIEFKDNRAALISELKAMVAEMDSKSEMAAKQILIEGKNAAYANALHDTNFMRGDALELGSHVDRISPCIYSITLGSTAEYASHQEFGPKSGKRKWRFRPFIRPSVFIMQAKANECIERVFG